MGQYRMVDHTADLGIRVQAGDLKDLFRTAGRALTELLIDPRSIKPVEERQIRIAEVPDVSEMLIKWLKSILSLFHLEHFLVREIRELQLNGASLSACLAGEVFQAERHHLKREIKAVTYHQAEINALKSGYEITVIFDT